MPHAPELDPQSGNAHTAAQITPARRRCRHIFTAGNQCGSPCLRGEQFCYYHHTTRRPVADPATRAGQDFVYNLPNPEDRASVLAAVAQVMQAIARRNVDPRTASLLLYSLQIALCALPKEPAMSQPQSRSISAAASRPSNRRSRPASRIPAPPPVEEIVLDQTHGLIAPEIVLEEEDEEYEEEDEAPPRRSLARQLLDEVEAYEARQAAQAAEAAMKKAAFEEGRAAALKELEALTQTPESGSKSEVQVATKAAAEPAAKPEPTILSDLRACCRYATRHQEARNNRMPHTSILRSGPSRPAQTVLTRNRYKEVSS